MFKRRASKLVASAGIAVIAITGLSAIPASAISNGTTPGNSENLNVAKIVTGYGTCTGVLVDAQWIATVASCFTQNPAEYANLKTTDPLLGARALFGTDAARKENTGTPIESLSLYTGTDKRDIVLAKLATPALNTTPMKLTTTAPTKDEKLDFIGWGRTKTEWIPTEKKIGSFNINTVNTKELTITGYNPANTSLCLGDSGAPGIRTTANGQELAALNSRSWQKNCIGTTQTTNDGAYATRTDDITPWIQNTINNGRAIAGLENNAFIELKEFNTNSVCVTVKDRSRIAGATTQTEQCGDPASVAGKDAWLAKKWELVETAPNSNVFALRNYLSDKCLVAGGEGQPMGQQDCQLTNPSNQWQFFAAENNQLQVRSVANGLFLTNNGDKQAITVAKNTTGLKQRWAFNAVGKALYNIAPVNTYVSIENPGTPGRVIRHADWLGWSHLVNGNSPLQTRQDATWKIIPGLANDRCYSFESINFPGNFLYSGGSNTRTGLAAIAGKDTKDFTWCAEEAKAGNQSITFAKYSDRFRVLRMNGNELYQGALFPAGIPKADDQYRITEDTAWKLRDPLATPSP